MPQVPIEVLHKEIDLIQSCITRMANNSMLMKGWAITLVGACMALSGEKSFIVAVLICILTTLIFWYLDAFFLSVERRYRNLYQWVITNRDTDDSFLYDLNPYRLDGKNLSVWDAAWSKTLRRFYGFIIAATIGILLAFVTTIVRGANA